MKELQELKGSAANAVDALDALFMRRRLLALCCSTLPASSSLMLAAVFPGYASSGYPVLVALALLFLGFTYVNRAPDRRLRRAIGLLAKNLDPGPLLKEAETQLGLKQDRRPGRTQALLDYLAIAQVNSGMHQEAVRTFTLLQKGGDPQVIAYAKFMGASSRVFLCLNAGDAEGAELEIAVAEGLLKDSMMPEAFRSARAEGLRLMKIRARLLRHDFIGIEEDLRALLGRFEKDAAKQLEIRFCLGLYYQSSGNTGQAHSEFDYVSANGGKLYLAEDARAKLGAMALVPAVSGPDAGRPL